MENYDVIVVGAGAAGAFMAYEFKKLNTDKKVLVIDGGCLLYTSPSPRDS